MVQHFRLIVRIPAVCVSALALIAADLPVCADQVPESENREWNARAGVVGIATRADPALAGRTFTEAYLLQPIIAGNARAGVFSAQATFNFEGITLERGELAAGNAGEGYIDRRHPHTYVHELTASLHLRPGSLRTSVTAGRGFAPFGTDDPMVRPFVKYPTNHHLAQILERWIVVGTVARGPLTLEAAIFNGDEPFGAADLGRLDRLGDSWSLRATLRPVPWIELQGSRAFVASPEHDGGGGLDQKKWSASARLRREMTAGRAWYVLAEWARTGDWGPSRRAFLFSSLLVEAAHERDGWTGAARFERTTRPEEERLRDGFRSVRPHGDENIIGITRWTTTTAALGKRLDLSGARVVPFVEVMYSRVDETTGSIFEPTVFYGSDALWTVSLGVRLAVGARHDRMGRYAAALTGH